MVVAFASLNGHTVVTFVDFVASCFLFTADPHVFRILPHWWP